MDLGFERSEHGEGRGRPRRLDYVRLLASVAAVQAGSRTAAAEARLASDPMTSDSPVEALARLFDPSFGWSAGVAALGGSFNPALAHGSVLRRVAIRKGS